MRLIKKQGTIHREILSAKVGIREVILFELTYPRDEDLIVGYTIVATDNSGILVFKASTYTEELARVKFKETVENLKSLNPIK